MNRNAGFVLEITVTWIGTGLEKAVAWMQRRKTEKQMMKIKIVTVLPLSANWKESIIEKFGGCREN